jgi:uncharacterized protein YkwD
MRSSKPALSSLISSFFKLSLSVLAFICLPGATEPSFGQNLVPPPVARLVTASSESSPYSRPSHVLPTEDTLKANEADTGVGLSPSIEQANPIERSAFDKTNAVRIQSGLQPLSWSPELCRLARMHSQDMATRGYFAHETPEGLRLRDRARGVGILHFKLLAENIAYNQGYEDPGAFAVERWMLSEGHRGNILYGGFQQAAIGIFVDKDGAVYLTQAFIER